MKNVPSSITIVAMKSLNYSHLANCSYPAGTSWNCVSAWEFVSVDEHILDANLQLSGMLGGGNGACSTCCRLLQVIRIRPMFASCCGRDVFSCWSFCKTVPLFHFLFGYYLVTEDSVKTSSLSDVAGKTWVYFVAQHLGNAHAACDTTGSLSRYQLFSL